MATLVVQENISLDPNRVVDPSFIDPRNYADDPECVENVRTKVLPLVSQTRIQRVGLEQFWQRMYMVWAAQNDVNTRLYSGMSDQYIPSVNTAIKNLISHLKGETFPIDKPVAVVPSPLDMFAQQAAPIVQLLQQRSFEQADVVGSFRNWSWQAYSFGSSPAKTVWKTLQIIGYKPTIAGMDEQGKPMVTLSPNPITLFEGPTFIPTNLLRWYIYPFNVQHIKDAQLVFEDTRKTIDEFKAAGQPDASGQPQWFNVEEALEKKPVTTSDITQTQGFIDARTALYGMFETQIPDENLVQITEIYTMHDPDCSGNRVPCKITVCGSTVLEIRQNPFIDQQPPYINLRFEDTLEHFYGRSKIQNVEAFNLAQNAAFNQGIDANMFAGNPLTGINALMLQGRVEDFEITPLGVYLFNGPPKDQMTFYDIPNTFGANLQLVEVLQDMIDKSMQAGPALSGDMPEKDGVTATETNVAAQASMVGVSEDAMTVKRALKQWLSKAWKLNQQFLSTQASIKLTQAPMFNIDPSALVGEYEFDFVTGADAANLLAQQAQALQAAQMQQMMAGGRSGAAISAGRPEGLGQNNQPGGSTYTENAQRSAAGMKQLGEG